MKFEVLTQYPNGNTHREYVSMISDMPVQLRTDESFIAWRCNILSLMKNPSYTKDNITVTVVR